MTEPQFLKLMDEFNVGHVFKPEGGKIMLTVLGEGGSETLMASEYKNRAQEVIGEIEDRRREVEENRFAVSLSGELPTGENRTLKVQYVKRNDQLNPKEEIEKARLLRSLDVAMARQRMVVGAMNYLQIHFKELQPRFAKREVPLELGVVRADGVKVRWARGIKSAALFCIKEGAKPANTGKSPLDLCRNFLVTYEIVDEEDYTPEQLYGNMQQILLLDRVG
jgi:hypothetical protein